MVAGDSRSAGRSRPPYERRTSQVRATDLQRWKRPDGSRFYAFPWWMHAQPVADIAPDQKALGSRIWWDGERWRHCQPEPVQDTTHW